MKTVYFDLDDFHAGHPRLQLLRELQSEIPQLKATLFTIPSLCPIGFPQKLKDKFPWIDLVPHGWSHTTNYECLKWTVAETHEALYKAEKLGFLVRGFKAPGWQISDGCFQALLERGYWVADQTYNNKRRPATLATYLLDGKVRQIHGHVGHLGGYNNNELGLILNDIRAHAKEPFGFVNDLVLGRTGL